MAKDFFFKCDSLNWNFLASFSNKPVENCFIYYGRSSRSACFFVKKTLLSFPKKFSICAYVERVFFGTSYVAATSLFVIPFSRFFKAIHFTPIGLLFNLRFMGTIFISQRTKNGLFEFTTLCLCFQKLNA